MAEEKFQAALDSLPTAVSLSFAKCDLAPLAEGEAEEERWHKAPEKVVVVLQFCEKGFGFGEVAIVQTKDGVFVDTECMSLDRVKRYLGALLDGAIADTDQDPMRHATYNRVMGRSCNPQCKACALPTG